MVSILEVSSAVYPHIIAYPAVFVYQCILDVTAMTDTEVRESMFPGVRDLADSFIIIITHHIAVHYRGTITDAASHANHAVLNTRGVDDTAVGNNRFLKCCSAYFRRRQHTRSREYCFLVIKK